MKKLMIVLSALVCNAHAEITRTYEEIDGAGQRVRVTEGETYTIRQTPGCDWTTDYGDFLIPNVRDAEYGEPKPGSFFSKGNFSKHYRDDIRKLPIELRKVYVLQAIQKDDGVSYFGKKMGLKDQIDAEFDQVLRRKTAYVEYLKKREYEEDNKTGIEATYAAYQKIRDQSK